MAELLLKSEELGVMRGERVLFRDISVTVKTGEITVLRGKNGSGKTTLLRILAGLTQTETGGIERSAPHHWIGHRTGVKLHETPSTHLALWAKAWGAPVSRIENALEKVSLLRARDVAARYLSAGQMRRTALSRLLLQERPLWILDEPFTALDDEGVQTIAACMSDHVAAGGSIVCALHGKAPLSAHQEVFL